jgi:hypothetical protein
MGRPRLLRPMSPDLAVLGDQLQAAVESDVRRRRARRQLFLNAAASLIIAIPLAISIATADFGAEATPIGAAGASASLNWSPGYDFNIRHIPDKPVYTREWARCLDANDCRTYLEPPPFAVDFPPRRA